jgi:type I restriction enzyme S subunit
LARGIIMDAQIIPDEYKKTEVGIIPNDWGVDTLNNVCSKITDGTHDTPKPIVEGVPFLTAIHVKENRIDFAGCYYLAQAVHDEIYRRCNPQQNDVLMVNIGAGVATSALVNVNYPFSLKNVALIKPLHGKLLGTYLNYYQSFVKDNIVDTVSAGGAQPFLSLSQIGQLFIALPDIGEQAAIANALSDVDALITSIEKLIAKKQAIKTATMQQLLTGKKRLPPFDKYQEGACKGQLKGTKKTELGEIPEDWDVINFGELFEINVSRKKVRLDSLVSFVGMQDVSENAKLVSPSLLIYEKVKSGFTYFERSDVLVAKITPCFENGKGCFTELLPTPIGFGSTEFHVLRANTSSFAKYIYFITVTQKFRNDLESEMVGSAGHRRVPFSALKNYQIPATRNKEEQIAIANILTDMDEEIQAFEQRLTKTQQIKQGMMQELLTGKTRLI